MENGKPIGSERTSKAASLESEVGDSHSALPDESAIPHPQSEIRDSQPHIPGQQQKIRNHKSEIRNPAFLRAERLTKTYDSGVNRVTVFEDLSLEVDKGEMVAIVGPSGAGKSTLLHLLGGLDRATSGSVKLGEFDILKLADVDLARFRNREVGFIFQFHHLLPEFTALENAMMPLLIGRWSAKAARGRAESLLASVGLATRATHRPGELSGGEQARVAMARALVAGPRLLLADEPTGDLDSRISESIHNLLKEVHASLRLTSVIVTHNERLAAVCDRVLHLEDGRLR